MAQPELISDPDGVFVRGFVEQIRSLVAAGEVARARELLAGLDEQHRAYPDVTKWVRALRPPEVRTGGHASSRGIAESLSWLRVHAADYFGAWVALRGDQLLGAHADHAELHRDLEQRGELHDVLFLRLTNG